MLPAIMQAIAKKTDLGSLTIVQIDAHADLRDELDGESDSHACAARRSLDLGVGKILQIGIRAFAREEATFAAEDDRVDSWLARDVLNPCGGEATWLNWLNTLSEIEGPVWLTLDMDGLDAAYVPTTGTPVPVDLHIGKLSKPSKRLPLLPRHNGLALISTKLCQIQITA